jgi:lysozyme
MKTTTKGGVAGAAVAAVIIAAAAIVQPWEGRELRAYQDIVGVWTICDGDTHGVRPGQVATPAECDQRLFARLGEFKARLDKCLTYPLPLKTEAAILSWTYNVGTGAACSSTLVKLANLGNLRAACEQLLRWNRAGGRVVKGLTNRREAERKLCLEGLG